MAFKVLQKVISIADTGTWTQVSLTLYRAWQTSFSLADV